MSPSGAGLAPLRSGISAVETLTPMQDLRVLGPLRSARHRYSHSPDVARAIDEVLPLVAEGLLAVLRIERDDLTSRPVDLDISSPKG